MKDRIKQIMESQHMTQQVFAQFIEMSPATLSSIFNGRTNPTMNIVASIKKKIPNISTDWLMFGTEPMYLDVQQPSVAPVSTPSLPPNSGQEQILDFDQISAPTPEGVVSFNQNLTLPPSRMNSVRNTRSESVREEVKTIDKQPRRIMEIRVFYDDQTWDSFVPAKK